MSTNLESYVPQETQIQHDTGVDESLNPKKEGRTVGPIDYMFMWIGDGVNLGNMTLGAS